MIARLVLALAALASCTPVPHAASATGAVTSFASNEDRHYATQAALLDPRCYHLITATGGTLDTSVPDGHAWHVVNAFAVTYGDALFVAQDAYPNARRSGFVRTLDVRTSVMLPSGTRVQRNDDSAQDSYIYYCDPEDVWSIDLRYTTDPRALYYERLARLETMQLHEVVLEATGGGAIDDDVHIAVPGDEAILAVAASVYDASWATIGWSDDVAHPLNIFGEINNSHSLRTGDGILAPLQRGFGLVFALCKGSTSDTPGSTDPAIAYPIKGSGSLLYYLLPWNW